MNINIYIYIYIYFGLTQTDQVLCNFFLEKIFSFPKLSSFSYLKNRLSQRYLLYLYFFCVAKKKILFSHEKKL